MLVVASSGEMDGSCAVSTCGLTTADTDSLNVEHELSRWLRDLDNSVRLTSLIPLHWKCRL